MIFDFFGVLKQFVDGSTEKNTPGMESLPFSALRQVSKEVSWKNPATPQVSRLFQGCSWLKPLARQTPTDADLNVSARRVLARHPMAFGDFGVGATGHCSTVPAASVNTHSCEGPRAAQEPRTLNPKPHKPHEP